MKSALGDLETSCRLYAVKSALGDLERQPPQDFRQLVGWWSHATMQGMLVRGWGKESPLKQILKQIMFSIKNVVIVQIF